MRSLSSNNYDALQGRVLVARDFLWLKARAFETNLPFEYGFWSGIGDIAAPVLNPLTGLAVTRGFEGSGSLIQIGDVPLVSDVSVQNVTITMSQIDDAVANIVRGYNLKQAGVEIYRGLFDPDSRQLVDPAFCRFFGFVDDQEILTPKEGEAGSVTLTCASHTQEMTRSNPDTRSNDSQKLRSATDNFFQDTTVVGDWQFFWGRHTGKIDHVATKRISTSVKASNR